MSMDIWWEVEDMDGFVREFRDLKEALDFAERVGMETGEFVVVRQRCGVPEEEL